MDGAALSLTTSPTRTFVRLRGRFRVTLCAQKNQEPKYWWGLILASGRTISRESRLRPFRLPVFQQRSPPSPVRLRRFHCSCECAEPPAEFKSPRVTILSAGTE